jgi:hypothetical protein
MMDEATYKRMKELKSIAKYLKTNMPGYREK